VNGANFARQFSVRAAASTAVATFSVLSTPNRFNSQRHATSPCSIFGSSPFAIVRTLGVRGFIALFDQTNSLVGDTNDPDDGHQLAPSNSDRSVAGRLSPVQLSVSNFQFNGDPRFSF
jgi:hypothetical protein